MEATGVKVLVEAWDALPFYCVLVARADSERAALEAVRGYLARERAILVAWNPAHTTRVELSRMPRAWRVDPPAPDGVLFAAGRIWCNTRFKKQGTDSFAELEVDPVRAEETARQILVALRSAGWIPVVLQDRFRWVYRLLGRPYGEIAAGRTRALAVASDPDLERAVTFLAAQLDPDVTDWCLLAGGPQLVEALRAIGPGRLEVREVIRRVEAGIRLYVEPGERALTFFGDSAAEAALLAALPVARRLTEWRRL